MLKRVIVGADQEVTNEDFDRLGLWPQEGIDALVRDFLLSGRGFTGFQVVANGLTAIDVAPGRFYDAGDMFGTEATDNKSVAEYVPFTAGQKVIATLIVQGREEPGYEESRNNEREVPTSSGNTTVQRVPDIKARAQVRNAILAFIVGAASPNPQPRAVPIDAVAVADILIGTGGIETITRRTENEAPELDELARAFQVQEAAIALINQAIGGIRNDLAALGRLLASSVSAETLAFVTADLGRVKDRLSIPDTTSPYGSDHFLTTDKTDIAHVDYRARVEEGIRFPYANFWKGPLALQNPNDPNFMHAAQGLICPKYTVVDGIAVDKRSGSKPLGGTVYQTMQLTQLTMSREVVRYGDYFTVCSNSAWWQSGQYDPAKGIFRIGAETYQVTVPMTQENGWGQWVANHQPVRARKFWLDDVKVPYDVYAPVPHQIQGVVKAQSFILSQDRWIPSVWLGIERWGANAEVTAVLVECHDDGTPNPGRMLDKCTLAAAQFKTWPERTTFPFAKPVFGTKKTGLYAVIWTATGDVTVAMAEGQEFLGGTHFETTDGVFWQGDLTQDQCFGVNFCRFELTQLPVRLQGLNLDGGIHNIRIKAGMIAPTNSDATWALQVAGVWRDIAPTGDDGNTLFAAGVTPFYDFRVMLSGNEWAMPIIDMAASEVTLFRADVHLDHLSLPVQLPVGVNATTVKIRATAGDWDPARHTLVAKLRYGAGYATVKTHTAVVTKGVVNRPAALDFEWTFTFAAPGINAFVIEFVGDTNNARVTYHVEERVHNAA